MPWMHGFGWGGMIFGGLLTLLFWVAVIVLIVFAVRTLSRSDASWAASSSPTTDRALEILRERYARGEITTDEYNSMRHDLTT